MHRTLASRSLCWSAASILAVVLVTGCVKNKVVVHVKPDGSGNIIVSRIFSKESVAMYTAQMEEMKNSMAASGGGGHMEMPADPFFDEAALKREAGLFGPGVTFVKASKFEREGRGSIALYAFKDVNEIFVNPDALGPQSQAMVHTGGGDEAPVAEKAEDAVEFHLAKGQDGAATLKIVVPAFPEPDTNAVAETGEDAKKGQDEPAFGEGGTGGEMQMLTANGNPYGFTGQETQGEVMKRMFKGMEISVAVEVEGTVVASTASNPDKAKANRYTLMAMEMDKVMATPKGAAMLNPAGMERMSSLVEFCGSLKGTPGVTVESQKEVTITFK